MTRLDKEEQEILDALDRDKLVRAADADDRKHRHTLYSNAMVFEKMVARGLADARNGRVISHEELQRKVRSWRR